MRMQVVALGAIASAACASMSTPRIEDAPAPRDYLKTTASEVSCDPAVELVRCYCCFALEGGA